MEQNETPEVQLKEKKPRKRMKAIYSPIKQQMEFYFSDSNLNRDRFMKKQIKDSKDGFVDLQLFLNFNKIKNLTLDSNVIAASLKHSKLLQISEDGQKVKRTKPLSSPKDIDNRTIYVECLPHNVDHEWIKRIFSGSGTVLYVSIPRYKSTGDTKGFAFVEFDSVEAANKACEDLNNPPAEASEKPGKFPRTSKQLTHLQKSVGSKDDADLSHEKMLPESPTKSAKKRRRRHRTSECSDGENVEVLSKQRKLDFDKKEQNVDVSQQEKSEVKHELNDSKNEEGEEKDVARKKNKKRKRSKGEGQSSVTESETSDQLSVEESDKESRKRKICDSTEGENAPPLKLLKGDKDCESSGKANDNKENSGKTANLVKEQKSEETTEDNKEKKKKKKRNHKTKHREKDIPELRVISKQEWLGLKAEYLKLQKESMNELKKTLTLMKKDTDKEQKKIDTPEEKKSVEVEKVPDRPKIEYIPNVIVHITSGRSMFRKEVKEDIGTDYQVAYIDIKEGEKAGYIRMKDEDSAKKLAAADSGSYFFTLLQEPEEKDYWDKLEADRHSKFTSKHSKKKRGSQKLVDKAQKISKDNISRTHVKFDD